jgi:DNA-binding transcriptional LysR family regulator
MTATLSLAQVRAFAAVAKCNSFTHAAEELQVTQPYVSGQISALEAHLGLLLFSRIGRRAYLNEAGKIFSPHATSVLESLRNADRELEEFRGVITGHVTLAASSTPGAYIFPKLLQQFLQDYPGIEVAIQIKDKLQVEQLVLRQQVELGVIACTLVSPALSAELIGIDRLLLIVGCNHHWAKKSSISIREIREERLIVREHTSGTRILVEEELKLANVQPKARLELSNNDAIKEAVIAGLGMAFLSELTVRRDIESGLIISVPLVPKLFTRTVSLLTLQGKTLSPAATILRNLIVTDFAKYGLTA